jgi:pimeloyl-[acyl-carrier protein] methyl ester esterase
MNLQFETTSKGFPFLLLHGWGMHGGMWSHVAQQLAPSHRVHSIDLPGYGGSATCTPYDLDTLVHNLSAQFDEPLSLCGWSLGGQVALRWAQLHPAQIDKLVLVAATPCFVQQQDWTCAMAADTLQEFSVALLQNYQQTLRRFLGLQLRGGERERELLADLRARLFAKGDPDVAALQGGLEILRDTDLRATLPQVNQPTLLVAGERDTLTPLPAMQYLLEVMPNAQLEIIKGAAHAPFLSHPEEFVSAVENFMQGKNN